MTSGIVSALARSRVGVSDYQSFIQTDAAINPGNSGGALIDINGRLVGINTAIFSRSGGSNGIGFAVPANMVEVVIEAAKGGTTVKTPLVWRIAPGSNAGHCRLAGVRPAERGAPEGGSSERSGIMSLV